ncbi:MAG: small-conductance mechanosensitive channel [Algicola sp.]|nr:small-conductance mechanosensitive channel [Algicola sp.]
MSILTTKPTPKRYLLCALLAIIVLPLFGSYLKWGGLPPGFGLLPGKVMSPPGFDLAMFIVLTLTAIPIWSFVVFPKLFGFKPAVQGPEVPKQGKRYFPIWFWLGGLVGGLSWTVMWGQFDWLGDIRYLMFVPLWWGYIFFLDGLVYYRNNGVSFVSCKPKLLLICTVLSIPGWYYFEYLNFFVLQNWYYPYLNLLPSPFTYFWSALTFSTVWPSVFIWYQLLATFKPMRLAYSNGPAINLGNSAVTGILLSGLLMMVITSIWYDLFFWMIWLGPMLVMAATLALLGVWTPFKPIRQGNWNPMMMMAIATLFNSLTWEMWNYWSTPNNPNFWRYDLPYVHDLLIFEMPILGFSGYLFFGPVCWVFWIMCGKLLGFSTELGFSSALHLNETTK